MKKLIILFPLLLLSLTACNAKTRDESEISEAEAGGENIDATWDFSEIHGSILSVYDRTILIYEE